MTVFPESAVTYRARWVWSRGRWVDGGRVTIHNRAIKSVTTDPQSGEIDLGEQILLPGLINAHTHLEFSSLVRPLPFQQTFASWIREVVKWRSEQTEALCSSAIDQGLRESARAGVAVLGEISTRHWDAPVEIKNDSPSLHTHELRQPQLVVFDEVLGLQPSAIEPQLTDARRHLELAGMGVGIATAQFAPQSWLPGLSPHAPYSVSCELFAKIVDLATARQCPVAMHLAETREELELLAAGTGPLVDLFVEWGLWTRGQRAAFDSPGTVLQALSSLPRVLVIHGNYLSADELDELAGRDQFSVVYCPRTHSYFQHDRYPLAEMLRRGIRVTFGTDSRASNPDLNLLSEMRHAATLHPEVAPAVLLDMATRKGAEALGLGAFHGDIASGRCAEFCLLPIPPGVRDPFEAVFAEPAS